MSISFTEWLTRVLTHGESVQDEPPVERPEEQPAIRNLLRVAFNRLALDVAAPPIAFDPNAAAWAAATLARASWNLVKDEEQEFVLLPRRSEPATAEAHLSADVTLRFLPAVYHRFVARNPEDESVKTLSEILRSWPLSGVLADLDGAPAAEPTFDGHLGLQLLYAERLARTGRPGWVPNDGPAREQAERAFAERGKPIPVQLQPEPPRD